MAQLTVTQFAKPILVGQRGTARASDVTRAGPAAMDIGLGKAVAMEPGADFAIKLPDGSGVIIAGISYNDGSTEYTLTNNAPDPYFPAGQPVPYVQRGSAGVVCETDVTAGTSPVYARFSAGTLGNWRTDDDDGT